MKPPINFGPGVAPAITAIPGGWRLAIGGGTDIMVYDVDHDGRTIVTRTFTGFGFPVLDGPWLGYKCNASDGWKARLRNLADDSIEHTYDPATGNFPLGIGSGVFAWQAGADYAIRYVDLADPGTVYDSTVGALGAPDGIAWIEPSGHVALCKDVRVSVAGITNPSRCGIGPAYTYAGEHPTALAIAAKSTPTSAVGVLLVGQESYTPKIAQSADGQSFAIVTYGREGVRLVLLTRAELAALPTTIEPPVVLPPQPPVPTRAPRFWFGPNIASADLVRLFDDPRVLKDVGVFQFYTQQILDNGGSVTGPNTFATLTANHVFKKLQAAGIATAIEGGSLSDLDCVTKIRAEGGDVHYFCISEPLVAKTPVATVVQVIKATKALGVKVVWIEAWSAIKLPAQQVFLNKLIAEGAKPDAWHLDIDRKGAARDHRDVGTCVKDAKAIAAAVGIPLGIILWGDDGHVTDAEYLADTLTFAKQVKAMVPVDHLIVQSWAKRAGSTVQDIPANLGPNGLLASLSQTVQMFGAPTAPPPETIPIPPVPPKELTNMIAYAAPVPGFLAGELAPHPDGAGMVMIVKPNGKIVAVTPDGAVEERDRGAAGAWEKFKQTPTSLIAERDGGKIYVLPLQGA